MGVTALQDNMGIKEISIAGSEKVKVDLAPIEELMATTQCCCTACSFYTKWPECCGVNESNMLCCCSTELGVGCFQYKDEHKKIQSVVSTSVCLDYTGEKTIWQRRPAKSSPASASRGRPRPGAAFRTVTRSTPRATASASTTAARCPHRMKPCHLALLAAACSCAEKVSRRAQRILAVAAVVAAAMLKLKTAPPRPPQSCVRFPASIAC